MFIEILVWISSIFDAIQNKIVLKSDALERIFRLREAPEHLLERKKDYSLIFYSFELYKENL